MKAELFYPSGCELAEGPIWYQDRLWWVDIEQGMLLNSAGKRYFAGHSIGAALPCVSGKWILAGEQGFYVWDLEGAGRLIQRRASPAPEYRFNDAKVGPDGSLVAGSLNRGTLEGSCAYYQLTSDLECVAILSGIGLCNGLDWNVEKGLFYYTDTGTRTVHWCPVGRWSEARVLVQIDEGLPDGLCIDTDGNIWVALWGASKVICIDGLSGTILKQISVPVPNVSSCCFGGEDLKTLFITTARIGLEPEFQEKYPDSGSIFSCRPGVQGVEARLFND